LTYPPTQDFPPPYYDVTGDGYCAPFDALLVINRLNSPDAEAGEGESLEHLAWFGGPTQATTVADAAEGDESPNDQPAPSAGRFAAVRLETGAAAMRQPSCRGQTRERSDLEAELETDDLHAVLNCIAPDVAAAWTPPS
jgi:hypothetical protein